MQSVTTNSIAQQDYREHVQLMADSYLADVFGLEYTSTVVSSNRDGWSVYVRYHHAALKQPCVVGRLFLDREIDMIQILNAEQVREIRECANWHVARIHGELARDADGYVSRHQARRLARRWIDQHLTMKCGANGGTFISSNTPVWQFSIYFDLRNMHIESLDVIDVDALTGAVIPLRTDQIENLRERVHAVIQHQELATAA